MRFAHPLFGSIPIRFLLIEGVNNDLGYDTKFKPVEQTFLAVLFICDIHYFHVNTAHKFSIFFKEVCSNAYIKHTGVRVIFVTFKLPPEK